MKHRNPAAVFFLSLITFGIYALVWSVKTKNEMNRLGCKIPTAWLILIPFVGGIYWQWKYSEGVEQVTGNKISSIMSFILLILLSIIGMAILQNEFNKLSDQPVANLPGQVPPMGTPVPAAPLVAQNVQPTAPIDSVGPQQPPQNPPTV